MRLLVIILLLPVFLVGGEWSSTDGKTTISLQPDQVHVGEKVVLRIEIKGNLVDGEKLRKALLDPLNGFTEKLKVDSLTQEKDSLTYVLVPLVDGQIPLHLEKIPLMDGKFLGGEIAQLKVAMPPVSIHNLAIMAAKPFPLDKHPIVDLSADNRFRYANGEKALEKEKLLQAKMFRAKRFPLGKLLYAILAIICFAISYFYRIEIAIWLKAKLISPYNPERQAKRSISSALSLYGYDARFFLSVSDALRRYFGDVLATDVDDLTTQELVEKCDADPQISKESLENLSNILHQADLIKFAKVSPPSEAVEKVSSQALELISEMAPKQDEKGQKT